MSDRDDFINKAKDILDFIDDYGMVRFEHLEKFFPESKKAVGYLIKNQRLHKSPDEIYVSTEQDLRPDKCLMSALGVLADVFAKVKTHTRAEAPAQISFITHSGDYYEIIYVSYGMEAMTMAFFETFETGLVTKRQGQAKKADHVDATKRMVIVEDKHQMDRLCIPGTVRFVLAASDGSLSYFKAS